VNKRLTVLNSWALCMERRPAARYEIGYGFSTNNDYNQTARSTKTGAVLSVAPVQADLAGYAPLAGTPGTEPRAGRRIAPGT
jgi:hypothetical protein